MVRVCLSTFLLISMWVLSLSPNVQDSANFQISLRRNYPMCSCIFSVSMGRGIFKKLICHILVQSLMLLILIILVFFYSWYLILNLFRLYNCHKIYNHKELYLIYRYTYLCSIQNNLHPHQDSKRITAVYLKVFHILFQIEECCNIPLPG